MLAYTRLRIALWSRARRLLLSIAGAVIVLVAGAGMAAAAEDGGSPGGAMSWILLEDSRGLSVWQYNLNIHRGSAIAPHKFVYALIIDIPWQVYRLLAALTGWLLRFTLEFGWLKVIAAPFTALSNALDAVVGSIGLGGVLLVVTALVCVVWMMRGLWALGLSELMISLAVAALAATVLTNPMDRIIGEGGLLYEARDLGLEVAVDLAAPDDPDATVSAVPDQMSSLIVDTFVRQPHQLVNYGRSFEGGECESAYDEAVAMEPLPADRREPREHIRDCDEAAFDHADNPDPAQVMAIIVLFPAGVLILLLTFAVTLSLWIAVLLALAQGLKAIISLVVGVLPGRGRGMLLRNIADLVIALALVAFASIFMAGFMTFIRAVFANTGTYGWNLMMTLFLVDLLLVVGIVLVWRYHKAFRRAGERLAEALAASRPGKATALPDRTSVVRDVAKAGASVYAFRRLNSAFRSQPAPRPGGDGSWSGGWQVPPPATGLGRPQATMERVPSGAVSGAAPGEARRALGPAGGTPQRLAIGPGRGKPGSHAMPPAGGPKPASGPAAPAGKLIAGAALRGAAAAATGGASSALVAGAKVAGRAVGVTRRASRALSPAGQARRAGVVQRLAVAADGSRPSVVMASPLPRQTAAPARRTPRKRPDQPTGRQPIALPAARTPASTSAVLVRRVRAADGRVTFQRVEAPRPAPGPPAEIDAARGGAAIRPRRPTE